MNCNLTFIKSPIIILSLLMAIPGPGLRAQDYLINFRATGEIIIIDSVRVENLDQNNKIIVEGINDLHLLGSITGIRSSEDSKQGGITLSPNPMNNISRMQFFLPESGETAISIYDIAGKQIVHTHDFLTGGEHSYLFTGIDKGLYIILVSSGRSSYSEKLVCNGLSGSPAKIAYENTLTIPEKQSGTKGTMGETVMQYNTGDRLRLTGISGIYRTVVTDIPTESKTIDFTFIPCIDGDKNNYPVTNIGGRVWMTKNLKTTKFNDETVIPNVTEASSWSTLATPGFCWHSNDPAKYKETYGALYNWHAVNTEKLCPLGWHVPTDEEWTYLTTFLGGESGAGAKLKETGTEHWMSYNFFATDEAGFTALPGGFRYNSGNFGGIRTFGYWWSSTQFDDSKSTLRYIFYDDNQVARAAQNKGWGISVRCIKNAPG